MRIFITNNAMDIIDRFRVGCYFGDVVFRIGNIIIAKDVYEKGAARMKMKFINIM